MQLVYILLKPEKTRFLSDCTPSKPLPCLVMSTAHLCWEVERVYGFISLIMQSGSQFLRDWCWISTYRYQAFVWLCFFCESADCGSAVIYGCFPLTELWMKIDRDEPRHQGKLDCFPYLVCRRLWTWIGYCTTHWWYALCSAISVEPWRQFPTTKIKHMPRNNKCVRELVFCILYKKSSGTCDIVGSGVSGCRHPAAVDDLKSINEVHVHSDSLAPTN